MADLRNAVLVGGNRIPFGRIGGAYASATNIDMLTAALDGLVARYGLAGERLGEVAAGAVLKHSRDFNLTREAVLSSARTITRPPTTSSRRAPPASPPRFNSATASGSASSTWPSPAGSTRRPIRRSR